MPALLLLLLLLLLLFKLSRMELGTGRAPGGPPGLAWVREASHWLGAPKWPLPMLLLRKPPTLDMLDTDAPAGVAGGVAAQNRCRHKPLCWRASIEKHS
jgi:hypothetical protein